MSEPDIIIRKLDESYIQVDCAEQSTQADLNSYFTMFAANYEYHPLYRKFVNGKRKWDGKMRLYSTATHKLYAGLLRYVLAFSEERKLKVQINDDVEVLANFSVEEAKRFFKALNPHSGGKPIETYEHQIMGLAKAVRYKRALLISPTSTGKSLMIYGMVRYFLQHKGGGCKRGLIVVPTTSLVEQMYKDFQDYTTTPDHLTWQVEVKVQRLYEAYDKEIEPQTQLLISTWQSIYDHPPEWFKQFDFVIGDEAQGYKSDSLKTIMTNLVNARYRIGTTGTLDDYKVHRMIIEGHFGPYSKLISTKEAQERGIVAPLRIKSLILKHKVNEAQQLHNLVGAEQDPRKKFVAELEYLTTHVRRNTFIKNLAMSLKGNRLVLFNYIEHGQELYDLMAGHQEVYLVNGGTSTQQREWIRTFCEKHNDAIIIASYGVFSTGVNIKNLPHLIFASPSKSKNRVLQSIGRILRLHKDKTYATLYDITDDLQDDDWINITLKQYVKRLQYYNEESWVVKSYIIDL